MQDIFYISLVAIGSFIGACLGYFGNYLRGNFSGPEKIFDGGIIADIANDVLSSHNTMFEETVIGAKWDDYGYWDSENNRNLIYYMVSGFVCPIIFGIIFWGDRIPIVKGTCQGLQAIGLHPPLC